MINRKKAGIISLVTLVGLGTYSITDILIPTLIMSKLRENQVKGIVSKVKGSSLTEGRDLYEYSKSNETSSTNAITVVPEVKTETKRLEDYIEEKEDPSQLNFSFDEMVLLGRLIPVKSTIEKGASFYGSDPVWFTQTLFGESNLFPLAYNKKTKDFGLTQEKMERYRHAMKILSDSNSKYYFGENLVDNIYNPKTNLITTLCLVKEIMDETGLTKEDTDALSAIYNKGFAGILKNGEFSEEAKTYLNYLKQLRPSLERVLQCFKYNDEEIGQINSRRIKEILSLYDPNATEYEEYDKMFSFYISNIDKEITFENRWEMAVMTNEAFNYFRVMKEVYYEKRDEELSTIYDSALNLKSYVKQYDVGGELEQYISATLDTVEKMREKCRLGGSTNGQI